MSSLKYPLKDGLVDPVDEVALQRMWSGVAADFPRLRRRRPGLLLAVAAVAAAAIVLSAGLLRRDRGPLRFADGRALAAVDAPAAGVTLALSDGSSIALGAQARFEPLESSGSAFAAILARGSGAFEVRPGGPRRWEIECGLATVEVVGTHFSCERSPGRLHVAVQRGEVLVRGERIPDRVRRLEAGQSLDVVDATVAPVPATAPAERPAPGEPSRSTGGGAGAGSSSSWRELARRGRHGEAFAALGAEGIQRESKRLGVKDLFALADVARLSGHPADAVAPLERILGDFAGDPQASLAAFALGRLELDSLGRPARGALALERALALGIPRSLREDVRGRLVEAYARAGNGPAARAAAEAYAREFPDGHYRKSVEAWLPPR